ncbi:EamA-like transporter family protein [Roseovarius nanhaiticus]|uniref:EamA-like transporter family protein n=1 Tax=Roseovarius nanhaiticus TaxID=573024 RepID=A0A1N7H625_9RHOB|nr:DMT family transporter [Roseovarius nanhaiticus]SEL11732.1 EamA-like transporter family protein [Roseovarius nanhaiticus]SIS20233.1 EamA-like transporter family protein [Roseovarius nanhaiticus]
MRSTILPGHPANLLGSLWMITAMALFAVEDSFVKVASQTVPVGEVLILFGLGGAAVFACLLALQGKPLFQPEVVSRPMRIRVCFEVTGRLFWVLALALTPLSSATVILQATPLVVVAGAALVFGERVGWRRWSAIGIGMTGVIVIIQPGLDSFSALSILALIAMVGFAGRDLASRAAPASISTAILGLYGFLAMALAGLIYALWSGDGLVIPSGHAALQLLGAIAGGTVAYACLMKAMRTGDVSAVTPFRYTRLLFGIALGVVLFGEEITVPMLVGSGLIVASGIFILWRSRKIAAS